VSVQRGTLSLLLPQHGTDGVRGAHCAGC
jgi:hypothetical protein